MNPLAIAIDSDSPKPEVARGAPHGDALVDDLDPFLNDAFRLAYFLRPDKEAALSTTIRSLALLEVSATHQDKRRYAQPRGRRTKVSKTKPQLLQDLICCLSLNRALQAPLRSDRFDADPQDPDDRLIRFVALLVRLGVRRSSFYVNLSISRFLCDYSTAETCALYDVLLQDPERIRHRAYFRRCKGVLMSEIQKALGPSIETHRGAHGEVKLRTQPASVRQIELVQRCLRLLTPWQTCCPISETFDPLIEAIPQLKFSGDHPDDEHPIEMHRAHAILDPRCYERLTASLGLDRPPDRLRVPRFLPDRSVETQGWCRRNLSQRSAPELSRADRAQIVRELRTLEERRIGWARQLQ
ncbi:MAG: hypothetical protein AAF657_21800 [Acidobacteriota bacterium]